jgi:hypothetical protein
VIAVGAKRFFDYPTVQSGPWPLIPNYLQHRGPVTVLAPCPLCNRDPECENSYVIQAEDGWVGHASETELKLLDVA